MLAKFGKDKVLVLQETGKSEHWIKLARSIFHRQTQHQQGEKKPNSVPEQSLFILPLSFRCFLQSFLFLTGQMVRPPPSLSTSKEKTGWEVLYPSLAMATPWVLGPITLASEPLPHSWPLIGFPWPRPSLVQPVLLRLLSRWSRNQRAHGNLQNM